MLITALAGLSLFDLEIRPVFHRLMDRVEGHILVAFVAYCLHVTLKALLAARARG